VIVVLPFLAIIEQNARVYRETLDPHGEGIVLEHHSAVSLDGDEDKDEDVTEARLQAKQATENWDAPVIVTTAVQFLESLFSRRPGRCRKLHNIARSVVIFDEVQTLPFPLLDPILGVLRDLSLGYGLTSLLCSATRPTFARSANLPSGFDPGEFREVIEDPRTTFRALRRCRLELPFLRETWSWDDLADRLEREPTALVIVNLRKHAQALYDVLKRRGFTDVFHLSSTMCPAHREAVLGRKENPAKGTIYRALETGKCLVISTQVIEAGVDISFPMGSTED
jgi:CRISPR-associated endonuclease/helicase Cas3